MPVSVGPTVAQKSRMAPISPLIIQRWTIQQSALMVLCKSTHLSHFHLKKKSTATIPFSHAGHLKTSRRLQARSCRRSQGA